MHVFDTADQAACFFYSSSGSSFLAMKVRRNNAEIVLKQQWNTVKEACWLTNSRLSFWVVSYLFQSCFSPPLRLCHGCFGFLSASFQFHFSSISWVQFSDDRFLVARTLRQAWAISLIRVFSHVVCHAICLIVFQCTNTARSIRCCYAILAWCENMLLTFSDKTMQS